MQAAALWQLPMAAFGSEHLLPSHAPILVYLTYIFTIQCPCALCGYVDTLNACLGLLAIQGIQFKWLKATKSTNKIPMHFECARPIPSVNNLSQLP